MIEKYLGISTDYIVIGLAALVVVLIILMIVNVVQMSKLKKRYRIFMEGKNAKSLEDTLIYRLIRWMSLLKIMQQTREILIQYLAKSNLISRSLD